jgi:predicted permease
MLFPMSGYYAVLGPVLTVFLVIGVGFAMRRFHVLSREADRTIFRLVVNLLYPCLIIDSMVGNPALHQASISLLAPVLCMASILIGIGVGWQFSRLAGLKFNIERRTFAATTGINNYSFFAVPVLFALFDPQTVGVCFAFNMGSELSMWTIIALLISGGSLAESWRKVINGPLIAIILGLVLNLFPVREHTPAFLWTTIGMFGKCAIPFGLMIVGASFSDFTVNGVRELLECKRVGVMALLSRGLVMPLILIAAAKFLPVPLMLKQVLVVQAAMPAATFPVAMVQHYGGHMPTALRVVLTSTIAGLITIPLWIHFGLKWIG